MFRPPMSSGIMVTKTIANSEHLSIDYSFYKQRRVNFVVFLTVLHEECVCLSLQSKEKSKRNNKMLNAYNQICLY